MQGEICIHGDFAGGITVLSTSHPNGKTWESLGGYRAAFGPQMNQFISAVIEDTPLPKLHGGSVLEGTKDIMISQAIYKSIQSKKWERTNL